MTVSEVFIMKLKKEGFATIKIDNVDFKYKIIEDENSFRLSFFSEDFFQKGTKVKVQSFNHSLIDYFKRVHLLKKTIKEYAETYDLNFFLSKQGWRADCDILMLDTSVRTYNICKRNGIHHLSELLSLNELELKELRFSNEKFVQEIQNITKDRV